MLQNVEKPEVQIISEYEELLKIKEFSIEQKQLPLECTYQSILKAFQADFDINIKDKVDRWISISNARYFRYSIPVKSYFQAKMLYRDGYYEAAITFSRAICEMICYDFLSQQNHPFGNYENLELENFRTLVKFLGVPKIIVRDFFEQNIISKILSNDDRNFISSSYKLDNVSNTYNFKNENGRTAKNLNRIHQIFSEISFLIKDNFPGNTYDLINDVYDSGNTYVHARKSANLPKADAIESLNKIGLVLAHLYKVDGSLIGKTIKSGYSEFPDICSGVHFAIDAYFTPADAMRGYYNLPSQAEVDKMLTLKGHWKGEWNSNIAKQYAELIFLIEGEYLMAEFKGSAFIVSKENISIKLFRSYFHIIGYKEKKAIFHFELEFLNNNMLLGNNLLDNARVVYVRMD